MVKTLLSKRLHVVIVTMPLRRPTIVVAGSTVKEGSSPGRPPTADAEFPSPLSLTLRIRLSSFPK